MNDLLGDALLLERKNDKPEAAALVEVLMALNAHPAVAWCERMNSGAIKIGNRFVRFGWPGCPDVLGQMKDGRLIGVEVKSKTGRLRPEQTIFLERIRSAGGVAFMARDCRDVYRELATCAKPLQLSGDTKTSHPTPTNAAQRILVGWLHEYHPARADRLGNTRRQHERNI